MRQTTLRDELELQKDLLIFRKRPDDWKYLYFASLASLETLQRLAEDVDDAVYNECEELLMELRKEG